MGFFKYYPLWSLQELLYANSFIGSELLLDTIKLRYHQVGGVPRNVFVDDETFQSVMTAQVDAVKKLTKEQATVMAKGDTDAVVSSIEEHPKSAVNWLQSS